MCVRLKNFLIIRQTGAHSIKGSSLRMHGYNITTFVAHYNYFNELLILAIATVGSKCCRESVAVNYSECPEGDTYNIITCYMCMDQFHM